MFYILLEIIPKKDAEEAQWLNENELSTIKEDILLFDKKQEQKIIEEE